MAATDPISIVIVDDSALVLDGVRTMLAPYSNQVEVVDARIGEIPNTAADIVLVDAFDDPDACLRRVTAAEETGIFDKTALFVWRISEDRTRRALKAGAAAVLSKSSDAADLVASLQKVADGEVVLHAFPGQSWTERWLPDGNLHLTSREVQLLTLVANGLTNKEIGAVMFLAESSAKTYLKRIYRKIEVTNRAQATLRAVELGLAGPTAEPNF